MSEKKFFSIASRSRENLESLQDVCRSATGAYETGFGWAGVDTYFNIARNPIKEAGDGVYTISGTSGFFNPAEGGTAIRDILVNHDAVMAVRTEGWVGEQICGATEAADGSRSDLCDVALRWAKDQVRDYRSWSESYDDETGEYSSYRRSDWYMQSSSELGIKPDVSLVKGDVTLVNPAMGSKFCDGRSMRLPLMSRGGMPLDVEVTLPSNPYEAADPYVGKYEGNIRLAQDFEFESGPDATVALFDDIDYEVRWDTSGTYSQGKKLMSGAEIAERAKEAEAFLTKHPEMWGTKRDITPVGGGVVYTDDYPYQYGLE